MIYPIALSVVGWPVLIVGGGPVGERRAIGLLEAEANICLVAPSVTPALEALSAGGKVLWHPRAFQPSDLYDMRLVIAATNDAEVNAGIVHAARRLNILVNDAVESELGDFRIPAVHRVGSLTFAVETGGSSPSFSRRLRLELAQHFDESYARAAETLRSIRAIIQACVPLERRAALMEEFSALPLAALADMRLSDRENAVEEALHRDHEHRQSLVRFESVKRICASRGSALALVQARSVMAKFARSRVASTLLEIRSTGDNIPDRSLTTLGSGVFVNELETALLDRRADYAVHSCKDLPSALPTGLCIAAIPRRIDPRDALCSEKYPTLEALPAGAKIGCSSPRRRAQLLLLRPDLQLEEIRGNIDTRLRRLAAGDYDAILLAMAGLERLGQKPRYLEPFAPEVFVPAVGQGALAIETRDDDPQWIALVRDALNDMPSFVQIEAERAFLAEVHGGCHAPVGAYATLTNTDEPVPQLKLIAVIAATSGTAAVRGEETIELAGPLDTLRYEAACDDARALGRRLASRLLEDGGRALLNSNAPLSGRKILLGRTQDRPSRIADALRAVGAQVFEIAHDDAVMPFTDALDAILFPSSGSVAVIAQRLPAAHILERPMLIAAMGPVSAAAATAAGFPPHVVAPQAEIGIFIQLVTAALLEQDR